MSELKNISTLYSFDTELGADSVEWCPHEPFQNVFVCGNYELKETESVSMNRIGRILLFSISADNGLKLLQAKDTAAILDLKWCPSRINGDILLGAATASGRIELYKLCEGLCLESTLFFQTENSGTLILSLDWSTAVPNEPEILCSNSEGDLQVLKFGIGLDLQGSWHGHDYEAWIAAFYYWDPNVFFSGGDDSVFLKFDRRVGNGAVARNKSHTAGVTSIHSNISRENMIVTGSYDENIRLWDVRNLKAESSSIKMPGPLWRLKWDPFLRDCLLSACMLGGAHIVDVKSEEMKTIGSFYEHKNICYGADWSHLTGDSCKKIDPEAEAIIGTCSFYDHLLCISKVNTVI